MRAPHGGPGPPSDEGPSDLLGPQWGQLSICLSSQIVNPLDPLGEASQDSPAPALWVPEGTLRPPAMEVLWKVCLRQKQCVEANVSQSLVLPSGFSPGPAWNQWGHWKAKNLAPEEWHLPRRFSLFLLYPRFRHYTICCQVAMTVWFSVESV